MDLNIKKSVIKQRKCTGRPLTAIVDLKNLSKAFDSLFGSSFQLDTLQPKKQRTISMNGRQLSKFFIGLQQSDKNTSVLNLERDGLKIGNV